MIATSGELDGNLLTLDRAKRGLPEKFKSVLFVDANRLDPPLLTATCASSDLN